MSFGTVVPEWYPASSKYDWASVFDGQIHEFTSEDFPGLKSPTSLVRNAGERLGFKVKIRQSRTEPGKFRAQSVKTVPVKPRKKRTAAA